MKKILLISTTLILIALACSLTPADENAVSTSVAETMAAAPGTPTDAPAPTDTPEDIYHTGTAEGHVCFPSEYIPAMYLYMANVNTLEVTKVPIPENQGNFSFALPEGTYTAYAWLTDFSGGGTYSQAVPCGLSVNCTDHSLLQFDIVEGQTTTGIEVCDWYGGPNDVPMPPQNELDAYFGGISGQLGYPSESIPPMQVVAFNIDTQIFVYVETAQNQGTYTIEGLAPGNYQVVSYVSGENFGGGYSEFVPCGQTVECTDHSLITVQVVAGQITEGVDPIDFYAAPGAFPDNPVP